MYAGLARAVVFPLLLVNAGCSMQRMALDQTAGILKQAEPAFEREWDYELAARTLPANVKIVEGFLQAGPDNEDLLLLAAKAYTSLGLVVIEDQLEQLEEDTPPALAAARRGREMYLRAHRYGLRLAAQRVDGFDKAFAKGRDALAEALRRCDRDDAAALVWTAMPLASAINLSRDDIALVALLPKARAVMQRALELDEHYYHAAPRMVLGAMLGGVSKMLGGDPARGREHFERAMQLTGRRFLLVHVMYAKTYAVQAQDRKLFRSLLQEVLDAKLEAAPNEALPNVVAKRKARRLLAQTDEFF